MALHTCTADCDCRKNLDKAAESLAIATGMLLTIAFEPCGDMIETCYARVKVAQARLRGAMAAFRDHLAETASLTLREPGVVLDFPNLQNVPLRMGGNHD